MKDTKMAILAIRDEKAALGIENENSRRLFALIARPQKRAVLRLCFGGNAQMKGVN